MRQGGYKLNGACPHGDASQVLAAPPRKVPRSSAAVTAVAPCRHGCTRVKIGGRDYTMISWFLGKYAGEKVRKAVADQFGGRAVSFRGGDHKTLAKTGFANAHQPKELLPAESDLSNRWLATECKAKRPPHKPLQVKRGCSDRSVLWLVEDMAKHFKP